MHFTPTIFIAQLLATMQVLMTLDMPLSTTMALPVTSKPIESTVENLAWQAWIELPPEQKQQVKSRKVTPKSIFTLPLRVECPEGHKQVDTKCIPIVIGSNDVLIDLNALGLLVGNTPTEDLYDYDDIGEEMGSSLPYGSDMPMGEVEKSMEGITVELKPPTKDEPLKFNIFESKFNIFHEEPLEDYTSLSNEGVQSAEKEQNVTVSSSDQQLNGTLAIAVVNITTINDLLSEASNFSENNFEIYVQHKKNNSNSDSVAEESNSLTTLASEGDFKIEAISVPASSSETQNPNKLEIIQNDNSIQLVTNIMDAETTTSNDDRNKQQENDLQTLLQTESFLPLLQQATTTTFQDSAVKAAKTSSLTTVSLQEPGESSPDALIFNVDDEEMTTIPNVMAEELQVKEKQEFTRSITMNPITSDDNASDDYNSDNDQVKDTTLESITNDNEPLETTTPIQLDDTTIIETSSSLSTTPSTQQELKELLLQQEKAQKDFEELQRMRKGQKDQHVVFKKSKVEPVEVLSTTAAAATTTAITTNSLPTETQTVYDLTTPTATETVTPLLTVRNENDSNNNDRFYYQHFAKQDNQETQHSSSELTATATPTTAAATVTAAASILKKTTAIETIPLTSEIDLAEELRLINELVKGIRPATTLTTIKTMQATATTTTAKPTSTTASTKTSLANEIASSSSVASLNESSSEATKKTTPSSLRIWSKIMPLLTTTPKSSAFETITGSTESSTLSTQEVSNDIQTNESASSTRSNRNSKIRRLNGFNRSSTAKASIISSTATKATTIIKDSSPSPSTSTSITSSSSSTNLESSTENYTYEPYWWLPVAWRLDKPTRSEKLREEQEVKSEEQPLLLRFWSTYHAPKSS